MPIYEYRCQSCGTELEKLQKLSDPPLSECPECGKETMIKLVSASSFRLKGGGWYETDFKTGKKKNGVGDDGSAESGAKTAVKTAEDTSTKSAGSDSKTETKSESPKAGDSKNTVSSST
ncbi:MAG: zinc ribbon domain-containing protein [Pseudomonadota bacterium]